MREGKKEKKRQGVFQLQPTVTTTKKQAKKKIAKHNAQKAEKTTTKTNNKKKKEKKDANWQMQKTKETPSPLTAFGKTGTADKKK